MDVAYDHIQEEALAPEEGARQQGEQGDKPAGLNAEFQEAFKAVSASPWGARLGGFFGQVKKQSETLYTEAQKEYTTISSQATRGLTDLQSNLASRARAISINQPEADGSAASFSDPNFVLPASPTKTIKPSDVHGDVPSGGKGKEPARDEGDSEIERPESLPADIVKEATFMVSRFRLEAASRLKDVRKAEDAADEALLKFGSNIQKFFRDAVTVTAPETGAEGRDGQREVLFETNDSEGKRVFHSSRFDAQLHVIMSSKESFLKDPESGEWAGFKERWDVEKKTDDIAKELDRYEELRGVFGTLVPERVEYGTFWARYYFLKGVVEEEERRRKEVLKGAVADDDEEVGWGDEDEDDESTTPVNTSKVNPASQSTTTLTPSKAGVAAEQSPRRSNEEDKKSTADSDASYDMVSGATSKTPSSPKESKKDESDEEDWE
ncbi:BSD domain-containing protein [Sphaceloma murrayae]|uniref:BSD domain-containing protein n=1 Tax=Sphaceloma murrayae TaxID=2082308 RepID=A0A2K1QJN5_9PEZI|nr:BSD domain-containing protein [Sphaceloma murrayae]